MTESEKEPQKKTPQSRFEVYCKKLGINPNLLMLKVTLFMMYGASASLLPFLTIHMQSVGLTVEEIAIIYLALPLTTFLSPPLTGYVVDKFGHYKLVVILSLVLNGIFHHALVLIPQMEIPGEVPIAYVLRHPETGKVEVWWSPCPSRECPEEEELNLVLDDCLDHCPLKNINFQQPNLLAGVHQSIAVRPPTFIVNGGGCGTSGKDDSKNKPTFGVVPDNLRFHLENRKQNHTTSSKRKGNNHKIKGKSNSTGLLKIPVRTLSGNDTSTSALLINTTLGSIDKFPVTSLPTSSPLPTTTVMRNVTSTTSKIEEAAFFMIDMHPDLGDPKEQLGIIMEQDDNETVTDFRQHFEMDLLVNAGINYTALVESDLRCGGIVMATNLTYNTLKELAADCMLQVCSFREGGPEICPPDYKESEDYVFWTYFVLRFLGTTMIAASVTVMDPIALTMVQQYGGEFGRERLFSTIGMAIFSPITGILIDYSSRKLGFTDYSYAFYTYSTLIAISAFSVSLLPIGVKMPNDNLLNDMFKLLKLPHIIIFILFLYVLGNCWGFLESYLFLYLKELGASNYLLGLTATVGTLSSIPFLYGAESITKRVGHVNVIVAAFFAHALRLTGYSFIDSAWWCFPFEAMESLSVHLMWVAAATYCSVIAPKNLLATLIGILGMAHFSLGRGSGSFFGGLLIGTVGTRQAFKLMGLTAVLGGFCYGLLHFFWLHKYTDPQETKEAESEKLNSEDPEKNEREAMSESAERLSLMIRFNHRGSLTSLAGNKSWFGNDDDLLFTKTKNKIRIQVILDCGNANFDIDLMNRVVQSIFDANDIIGSTFNLYKTRHSVNISTFYRGGGSRRNSSNELGKSLLKSALEGHYRSSNPQLNFKSSSPQLSKPKNTDFGTPQQSRRNTPSQLGLINNEVSIVRRGSIKEEDETEGSEKDLSQSAVKPKVRVSRCNT